MAAVDSFFGFLDKYSKQLLIGLGALIVYKKIQSKQPGDDEKQEQTENNQRQDVNSRLTPPPLPKKDADGHVSKTDEVTYNAANKGHRSATYASQLRDHMYTLKVRNVPGVNTDQILTIAYNLAIFRITFAQLSADYTALQDASSWWFGDRTTLVEDLKFSLSPTNYLLFMQRLGLSSEKAYALTHPKKK